MNAVDRGREVIHTEIQGLQRVMSALGRDFGNAVEIILECLENGGKIVVAGIGKNLHVAEKISATLASTGSTSVVMNPTQALHGDLGIVGEGDVLLALSYSGESEEILGVIPSVRRLGARIVSLTDSHTNSLARCSDAVVNVSVEKEACPFNMAPTASTTATMAVGDALAMVLLEERGFKRDDYAKLHPGGAIGRALLMKVADIMRTGDRIVVLKETDLVRDALVAMTKARSGSAGVVDTDGRLTGIFTDGDLRRRIAETDNLLDIRMSEVMTPDPKTVSAGQLAVDVLRMYEKNRIDDLMVVDDDNRPIGIIDVQDLPRFKIL